MIRLYGHLRGSFRTVSEGLKHAFEKLGVLDGYVIGEQQEFSSEPIPGATAPIAVVVGDPLRVVMAHTQGMHEEIWLMLAPNSEGVPPGLKQQLFAKWGQRRTVGGFLAPSTWAKRVLEREFPEHPVELCTHGVLPEFSLNKTLRELVLPGMKDRFILSHYTSSRLDRKQTSLLVSVFKDLKISGKLDPGLLSIYTNPEYYSELYSLIGEAGSSDICLKVGQNLNYKNQAAVYHAASLIVQPSRAEGFGLVPLEAAACGVPSILTMGTGHTEYAPLPGQIVIPTGPLAEMDDYWGSQAPTVQEEDLKHAILEAYEAFEDLSSAAMENAEYVKERWSWERGASNLVEKWKKIYGPGE